MPLRSPTTMLSAPPSALKSMRSTPSVSIVTLAMSRKSCARPRFAKISTFSPMFAPWNSTVSNAVLAFDGIVAVTRVPLEHVVAAAEQRAVVAVVAEHDVRAFAADQTSLPWLPRIVSLPAPPSSVSAATPAATVVAVIASLPPCAFDDDCVVGVQVRDVHARREAQDRDTVARAEDASIDVVVRRAVRGHGVDCTVADRTAERSGRGRC